MGMEEDFFKDAVARLRDRHLSAYPENPPNHTFSPAFEKEMKQLLARKRISKWRVLAGRALRQAACIALAGSIGLAASIISVRAWSDRFFNMVEQKYPDHTSIFFEASGKGAAQKEDILYELGWVPDGFRRVSHGRTDDGFFNYTDYADAQDNRLSFEQNTAEHISISLDTEGAELEEIPFRGDKARIVEKGGGCTLLWYDDKYCFIVSSTLSREDTIRAGESVRPIFGVYPTLQPIPIEALPESYTAEQARANGDVLLFGDRVENLDTLKRFVEACGKENARSAIRLARFMDDGSACIYDLQVDDGHIYYTADEHRWPDSEQPWELGEEYERISILEATGTATLLLHSYHYEKPVEVVRYAVPATS